MPFFQEDDRDPRPPPKQFAPTALVPEQSTHVVARKASEESIRTDLCEGHVLDGIGGQSELGVLDRNYKFPYREIPDHADTFEHFNKGEAAWSEDRKLESLLQKANLEPPFEDASPLLPSPELAWCKRQSSTSSSKPGPDIERPRSALHSGDFTEGTQHGITRNPVRLPLQGPISSSYQSGSRPWLASSPPRDFSPFQLDPRFPPAHSDHYPETGGRYRATSISSSIASSFAWKAPTSPLVHSESNDESDLSYIDPIDPINISHGGHRTPRRHTLQSSQSGGPNPSLPTFSGFNKPSSRRDGSFPYQAHQPRRSLASVPPPASLPQTPMHLSSRRTSHASESSPLQMVGSYEESILRGRMSTTPSKPLDFVAQIGVLGLGKCRAGLKCPAHVTIPFPAVFYSYETTIHGRAGMSEDGPSPYVGQIDLENGLPSLDISRDVQRKKRAEQAALGEDEMAEKQGQSSKQAPRKAEKEKRRSSSPRAPPGGSYRIPEKGQVQIIIKNPNKTAVKLFLVPYDLAGMEPGTKTFIRQRSYSAGPIVDMPLPMSARSNAGISERPTLRYLVHLHMCSPSRGRYYLYKSIRVVFANRVPDGKEKLRNESTWPEPKYTVYKPQPVSSLGPALGGAGANLVAEKEFRRRSSGFPLTISNRNYDAIDGVDTGMGSFLMTGLGRDTRPVEPIPFTLSRRSRHSSDELKGRPEIMAIPPSKSTRPETGQSEESAMSWTSSNASIGYDKLMKGDVGYGGNAFSTSYTGSHIVESLLAKKLRDLGVQPDTSDS